MNIKIEQALKEKTHRYIKIAEYQVCQGTDHLEKIFQDIMDQGGEGIILRDPSTPFETGRSKGFLKHKVWVLSSIKIPLLGLSALHRNTETRRPRLLVL